MNETELMESRVRELSQRAYQNDYLTHTEFLSLSEQAALFDFFRKEGVSGKTNKYNGVYFVLLGGYEEAERKAVFFLPSWQSEEELTVQEADDPQVLTCLQITPVNMKFADDLTHRDFLGALMSLGIERDKIGDILTDEKSACVFVMKDIAQYICDELSSVKHTTVLTKEIAPSACTVSVKFEEVTGSVASERLDAVLAMVWHLSRATAQELVEQEKVFIDGRSAYSGGYDVKPGQRVSVRGFGKFIYNGVQTTTRKGRLFVSVSKFV